MDEGNHTTDKHHKWFGIWKQVLSFLAAFALAFIWVGTTRQKVQQKVTTLESDMAEFKAEWKDMNKHITTMDLDGSVATKNFINNYNKEQHNQYERLKKLEEEIKHIQTIELRIERLERNHNQPRSP